MAVVGPPIAAASAGVRVAHALKAAPAFLGKLAKGLGVLKSFGLGSDGPDHAMARYARQLKRRVQASQDAGLHPLFTLGGAGGYSPELQYRETGGIREGLAEFERVYGDRRPAAVANKTVDPLAAKLMEAQIRNLNASASRDEAAAQVALSQNAVRAMSWSAMGHDTMGVAELGVTPGVSPAFSRVQLPDGSTMLVPNKDVFEVPEGFGYGVSAQNAGSTWWQRLKAAYADASRNRGKAAPGRPFVGPPEPFWNRVRRFGNRKLSSFDMYHWGQ